MRVICICVYVYVGCFWMLWEDFLKYYDSIDVIYSGGDGLDSVTIDIKEDFGPLG